MKARTRKELYEGVPVLRGMKQVRQFAPEVVRQQQEEGEQAHIERLKWAKRRKVKFLSPAEWARATVKQVEVTIDDQQAAELADRLDAAYHFDVEVWKVVTAPDSTYNAEKHGNDWLDMQQTLYLCDPPSTLSQQISHSARRSAHPTKRTGSITCPSIWRRMGCRSEGQTGSVLQPNHRHRIFPEQRPVSNIPPQHCGAAVSRFVHDRPFTGPCRCRRSCKPRPQAMTGELAGVQANGGGVSLHNLAHGGG